MIFFTLLISCGPCSSAGIATDYGLDGPEIEVIHDIVPTNERLRHIKMAPTDACRSCALKDARQRRLTFRGGGRDIWAYAKALMTRMLRATPTQIPDDWILRPQFQLWPPKRRNVILWVLANVVLFEHNNSGIWLYMILWISWSSQNGNYCARGGWRGDGGEGMCMDLPCSHGLGHGSNPHLCWCKGPRKTSMYCM
jgi:hypothetical protein